MSVKERAVVYKTREGSENALKCAYVIYVPKLKLDQHSEMQMKLSELDKLQKSNIESMVQKATSDLRKKFEQDRENCLKTQQQQLTMKAKRDIDALRKRFKMMQTTGALERSPSCSESELSAEVIYFVILLKVKVFQKVEIV